MTAHTRMFAALFSIFAAGAAADAWGATPCRTLYRDPVVTPVQGWFSEMLIDPACNYVYATDRATNVVRMIATATGLEVAAIPVGSNPDGLAVSRDGAVLYVANAGDPSLSVIDVHRRREVSRVTYNDPADHTEYAGTESSVAVAADGKVFYTRGPYILDYDPVTGQTRKRTDFPVAPYGATRVARASGDGRFIFFASYNGGDPTLRYDVQAGLIAQLPAAWSYSLAVDRTGDQAIASGFLLRNHDFESMAEIKFDLPATDGVAVIDPSGDIAYRTGDDQVTVIDLKTYRETGTVPLNDAAPAKAIALSDDGRLLAVNTAQGGLALVSPQALSTRSLHAAVYSGADPARTHSILRFFNSGTKEGVVQITFADAGGGMLLGWDSPLVPPGAAHDFDIRLIEAAMPEDLVKPAQYLITITAGFPGTFTHLGSDPATGAITNLSTCSRGLSAPTKAAPGVLNSLDELHQSRIYIVNTTTRAQPMTLGLYDAYRGTRLGSFEMHFPGAGAAPLSIRDIERWARITPARGQRYVAKIEGPFDGNLQHVLQNTQASISADLTVACTFAPEED